MFKLVHANPECEVYEEERPRVVLRFDGLNAFLGEYMTRMRRAERLVIPAPLNVGPGTTVEVEIQIDESPPIMLLAHVLGRWPDENSELTEVQFFAGELTNRLVRPLAELALGTRHAAGLLVSRRLRRLRRVAEAPEYRRRS